MDGIGATLPRSITGSRWPSDRCRIVLALPLTIALLTLPGLPFAIWAARRSELSRWSIAAAVPAASVAVNFTAVWAWPSSRISRPGVAVYLLLIAAASVAVAVPGLAAVRSLDIGSRLPSRTELASVGVTIALVVASVVIGLWAWTSGIGTLNQPAPNYDAAQHGFMTTRIIESGGVAIPDVMVTGPAGVSDYGEYYPLGVHASTALISAGSGSSVARSLNSFLLVVVAIALPLGVFAFLRELLPDFPLAAPVGALAIATIESFPYKPISWGGIPLITGMSLMLASAAALVSMARRSPRSWAAALFVALTLVGVWHAHNSETVIAVVLAGVALAVDRLTTSDGAVISRPWLRDAVRSAFRTGLIAIVLLLPVISAVVRGGEERSTFDDTLLGEPQASLGQILFMNAGSYRNGMLLLLAVIGLAAMVRQHRFSIPGAFVAVVVGAYFTATTNHDLSRALTFPWWRQAERMIYLLALLAVLGVAALVGIAARTASRATIRFLRPPLRHLVEPVAVLLLVLVMIPTLLVRGAQAGRKMVFNSYEFYSPVSSDSIAGFAVLRDIAGTDGSVLTEYNRDGSMWMYAFSRVQPLYGIALADANVDPTWQERSSLAGSLGLIGSDDAVDALIRKYRVRAVYFDDRTYAGSQHDWSREMLRSLPALDEVFTRGSVSVFAIRIDSPR